MQPGLDIFRRKKKEIRLVQFTEDKVAFKEKGAKVKIRTPAGADIHGDFDCCVILCLQKHEVR